MMIQLKSNCRDEGNDPKKLVSTGEKRIQANDEVMIGIERTAGTPQTQQYYYPE